MLVGPAEVGWWGVRGRVRRFTSDELNSLEATRRVWPGHLFPFTAARPVSHGARARA